MFVSRFLPGARLPTYTACGYFRADFRRFALAAIGATLIWTTMLFGVSLHLGHYMVEHLGAWRWVGMAGFALTVVLAGRIAARLQGRRHDGDRAFGRPPPRRRDRVVSPFEFWPGWLFYAPVVRNGSGSGCATAT